MPRVVSDYGRKGNVKRRSDALRVLEFIQSREKVTIDRKQTIEWRVR